jgi:hypothetical protein
MKPTSKSGLRSALITLGVLASCSAHADALYIQGECGSFSTIQSRCETPFTLEQGGAAHTLKEWYYVDGRQVIVPIDVAYRGNALVISIREDRPPVDFGEGRRSFAYHVYDADQPVIQNRNACAPTGFCRGNELGAFSPSNYPVFADRPYVLNVRSAVPEPTVTWLISLAAPLVIAQRRRKSSLFWRKTAERS